MENVKVIATPFICTPKRTFNPPLFLIPKLALHKCNIGYGVSLVNLCP